MLVQQHSEELARALSSPVSDTSIGELPLKSALANKVLGFDVNGDPIAAVGITNSVSAFIATLIDDAKAIEARATLGIDGASGNIASGDIATDAVTTLKLFAGAVTTAKIAAEVFKAGNNVIINGNFDVWQRGTSFATPVNADYLADRWSISTVGAGAVTVSQETVSLPDGLSARCLEVDITTADATLAAGDLYALHHKIEWYDAQRFGLGTADATEMTLSFWIAATKTGTHSVAFRNGAGTIVYPATFTVNADDTWEYKTITITGDTAAAWLHDDNTDLEITFCLAAGSTYLAAADAWANTGARGATGQVNNYDSTANFYRLARVQLEVGGDATPFEYKSFAQALALCQRYYCKTFKYATVPGDSKGNPGSLSSAGTTAAGGNLAPSANFTFPVTMRGVPTITTYNWSAGTAAQWENSAGSAAGANARVGFVGETGCVIDNTGATLTGTNQWLIHADADAEL